jgi:hypothetical protein
VRYWPRCRQITERLSEARDSRRPLSLIERFHLLICGGCTRFWRQIRMLGDAAARSAPAALSGEAKERMRRSLR